MFIFYLVVLAQRADGGTAGDVEASREADGVRTGAGVGEQSACSGRRRFYDEHMGGERGRELDDQRTDPRELSACLNREKERGERALEREKRSSMAPLLEN